MPLWRIRNGKTLSNFVPKTQYRNPKKGPNVTSETLLYKIESFLIKLRFFSFISSEPAQDKLHNFVTRPQRQNSTQFRAQNVAQEPQKRA